MLRGRSAVRALDPQRFISSQQYWAASFCSGNSDCVGPSAPDAHFHKHATACHRQFSTSVPLKNSAVFASGWNASSVQEKSERLHYHEWHDPRFLADASVVEKEAWLESLLRRQQPALAKAASGHMPVPGLVIDEAAFLVVLRALSEASDAGAPRRAERWMQKLKELPNFKPTMAPYQLVIRAWANSSKEQAVVIVNRAERWLNEFLTLEKEAGIENSSTTPEMRMEVYNAYLDACTRGRSGSNKKNQDIVQQNARKADALLRRLHSECFRQDGRPHAIPNTESFNFVIRGWTRCRRDPTVPGRVLGLLRLMEVYSSQNQSSVHADLKSYCMTMDAFVNLAKHKAQQASLRNDGAIENPSLNGMEEMDQATGYLTFLHQRYDAGVESLAPRTVAYNILLGGWAGVACIHPDAPQKAEEILRRMYIHRDNNQLESKPDRTSVEKVMMAWSNSPHSNAGRRAQWWLHQLWHDAESQGDVELTPTTQTYNIAMKALGNSECARAAEDLLLDLGDKYREAPTASLCPNSESFSIVIHAWLNKAHSDRNLDDKIHSLHRGAEWLTSLRQVENEKNLSTAPELFNRVLGTAVTCAWKRMDILELAKNTFAERLESRHRVDVSSYASLLQVGLAAMVDPEHDDEREYFLEDIVRRCSEDGLVGDRFVKALVNSRVCEEGWTMERMEETKEELFPDWPLPPSWTRNLASERLHPSREDFVRQKQTPANQRNGRRYNRRR